MLKRLIFVSLSFVINYESTITNTDSVDKTNKIVHLLKESKNGIKTKLKLPFKFEHDRNLLF